MHTFLYLDRLGEEDNPARKAEPAPPPVPPPTAKPARTDASEPKPAKPLSQDAKFVAILRGAVQATGEDGWARLGAAGNAVKRQAPINPRNYGARNFWPVRRRASDENGQSYVSDRRSKDRTSSPRF